MPPSTSSTGAEPKASWLYAFIAFTAAALFIIGLLGQPDLVDNERRVGAYILDAVQHGHWMAQRDTTGEVASKPPMVTWIGASFTLLVGELNRFTIYLPSALATLVVGLLLFKVGRERFGWAAGLLAATAYLVSPMGNEIAQTARYDGLFALPVLLAALAAFDAWMTGRGWTWFWLAAAFGTLVKGPLGLLLGALGLLAAIWEWRSGSPLRPRGRHWLGLAIYLLICGGWFWLAYREMGPPLIEKQIGRELLRHAVKGTAKETMGGQFWEPTLAFLSLFLPWSVASLFALWRVVKHPSPDLTTRRFERFLFCWFAAGLVLFSIAAHQRSRLIFPIMPALALLTGRELARLVALWKPHWPPRALVRAVAGITAMALCFLVIYRRELLRHSTATQRTIAIREFADKLRRDLGAQFPLTYVGRNPSGLNLFPLQFYLNTMRPHVTPEQAAELLRGSTPAFVVVGKVKDRTDEGAEAATDPLTVLQARLGTNAPPLHELVRCDAQGKTLMRIVSNHPRLEWPAHSVSQTADLRVEARDARLRRVAGGEMWFERTAPGGAVAFSNLSTNQPQPLSLRLTGQGPEQIAHRLLAAGETWRTDEAAAK
jgi:4-amino-4-deoxy-L-arabinose transferase-like glycosyltransferase